LQLGYRERGAVIVFMTPSALANFKAHSGWDARRNFGLTTGQSVDDMEGAVWNVVENAVTASPAARG
jgi:2-oxo-4-hydroxy-4-carboxy--5-ureidoimidazoline (OHCU) decarboxylase